MRTFSKLLLLLCISSVGYSQNLHIGIAAGLSNYQGDLIDKYYDFRQTDAHFGIIANYELADQLMIRGGFTYAKVSGHDRFSKKDVLRMRNLSFESKIKELSLTGEFYINNLYYRRYSPYLFGGIALFHFNPYTFDSAGSKVFLKPLSTEGQGIPGYRQKPYSLLQVSFPFGAGIKYALTDNIRIGAELGFRKTFTDYLDDVSTSYADPNDLLNARGPLSVSLSYRGDEVSDGNPAYPAKGEQRGGEQFKDLYYFTGLNITFRIGGKKTSTENGLFRSRKQKESCPPVPL